MKPTSDGRRSLLVQGLLGLAGAWVTLSGGAAVSGCCYAKYGGPPEPTGLEDAGAFDPSVVVAKYGGPPTDLVPVNPSAPSSSSSLQDLAPNGPQPAVVKYGGPPEMPPAPGGRDGGGRRRP